MDNLPTKLKKRLYQLAELATRGVGGERENAEARLERLLDKYGIKMADFFETDCEQEFFFTYSTKFEERLFLQIALSMGIDDIWEYKGTRKLSVNCSVSNHAELSLKYGVYKRALKDEMDMTFHAFIHAQKLYRQSNDLQDEEEHSPIRSAEEERRLRLIAARVTVMDRVNVRAGIENKS
ncbi:hypothetical protein M2H09_20885 [Vibrio vulnificus]|nr:hypothetical protein [Vibrio vulnificus]